jgi:hypothetical protein
MAIAAPPRTGQPPAPTKDDLARQKDQERAWNAFRGTYKPPFKDDENSKFNVIPNRCGPTVTIGMYLLFGQGVGIDLDENAPAGAADYLKEAWGDEDDKIVFLQKMAISAGVNGHAFVQVVPPLQAGDAARFILIDPQTVSVVTDEDDCESVNTFIIDNKWDSANGQKRYKRRIYARVTPEQESPYGPTQNDAVTATWQISTWEAVGTNLNFKQTGQTLNWSYPFAPIQACQNLPNPHEYWGTPDISGCDIDMNEALAFVESNTLKIIFNQAHDIVVLKGINNPNQAPIKSEPGKWPVLPVGADLVAIQAHGDVANSLTYAELLRNDMDESSGINSVVLGRTEVLPRGTISGLALKMLYETALQKTNSKQRTIGKLLRKLCQIHLYFGKIDPDANTVQVILGWKDPVPVDEFSQWQGGPIEEQMGVSKTTSLSRRGLVYSAELKLREQEAQMEADAFNAGTGPAPQAIAAGNAPLPPEMGAMQETMTNAAQNGTQPQEGAP